MTKQGNLLSKTLVIGIIFLFIGISAFTVVTSMSVEKQGLIIKSNNSKQGSTTLITEGEGNRVFEVDNNGIIVWQKTGLNFPVDAERLANGNTLITEVYNSRVIEVNNAGTIVWQKTGLYGPVDAERLYNGNTLITIFYGGQIIEVNSGGTIVWQSGSFHALDAERLYNGNTLIAVYGRVIEVTSGGNIVWQKAVFNWSADVERLENGNTLITEYDIDYERRVIEVDSSGTIVWQKTGLKGPWDAERLANGNTLIAESDNNRVIEVYSSGTIVWQRGGLNEPMDVERTYGGEPDAPTIIGLIKGKPGVEYDYTFTTTDDEGDDVYYWIEWGDGTVEQDNWIGPYSSGEKVTFSHSWDKKETFIIKAKAKDIYDSESEWAYLIVQIPRNRMSVNSLFQLLFGRFSLLEVFLRAMNLLR